MNKLYPITGFIYSWVRRISLPPPYVSHLVLSQLSRQCPNKVISFSPLVHNGRGISSVSRSPLEEKYKQKDKIADNYDLIYRSPMNSYIPYAQCVCTGSMFSALLGFGYNYFSSNVWKIDSEFLAFGGMLVGFNVCTLYLVLQYVMRIYVSEDKYICVMPSLVPFKLSKLKYNIGDVKQVPPRGFLPWMYSRYKICSKSAIILEHHFRKPIDYNTMMARYNDS